MIIKAISLIILSYITYRCYLYLTKPIEPMIISFKEFKKTKVYKSLDDEKKLIVEFLVTEHNFTLSNKITTNDIDGMYDFLISPKTGNLHKVDEIYKKSNKKYYEGFMMFKRNKKLNYLKEKIDKQAKNSQNSKKPFFGFNI